MANKENRVEALFRQEVDKCSILINWLGQAGFLFKCPTGTVVCIDPYLSDSVGKSGESERRPWFPSFSFEKFFPDFVLCTHDHLDHTDPETLPHIAAHSRAIFCGPQESVSRMEKLGIAAARRRALKVGEKYRLGGWLVEPIFAKHTAQSIGVLLEAEGIRLYYTGDTDFCPELYIDKRGKADVLVTCINGKLGNLDAAQACTLARELGVKAAIPMHYGVIPSNTVSPNDFALLCKDAGIACYVLTPEVSYTVRKTENGDILLKNSKKMAPQAPCSL